MGAGILSFLLATGLGGRAGPTPVWQLPGRLAVAQRVRDVVRRVNDGFEDGELVIGAVDDPSDGRRLSLRAPDRVAAGTTFGISMESGLDDGPVVISVAGLDDSFRLDDPHIGEILGHGYGVRLFVPAKAPLGAYRLQVRVGRDSEIEEAEHRIEIVRSGWEGESDLGGRWRGFGTVGGPCFEEVRAEAEIVLRQDDGELEGSSEEGEARVRTCTLERRFDPGVGRLVDGRLIDGGLVLLEWKQPEEGFEWSLSGVAGFDTVSGHAEDDDGFVGYFYLTRR